MADKIVALGAADVFGLGSSWIAQDSDIANVQAFAEMLKADGDVQKYSAAFNNVINVTVPYKWSEVTGLGAAIGALLGSIQNAYIITEIRIDTVFNDFPLITFTGHNHAANAHAASPALQTFSMPADMIAIATGAFGAYSWSAKSTGDVSVVGSTYTLNLTHVDADGSDGNHWVGENIRGLETFTDNFIGNAGTPSTVAGWSVDAWNNPDSNSEFDTSSITAHRLVLRD